MNSFIRQIHPGSQFLLFISFMLMMLGLGSMLAVVIVAVIYQIPTDEIIPLIEKPNAEYAGLLMWLNNFSQFFAFVLPSLIYVKIFGPRHVHGLMLRKWHFVIWLAPLIMLCSAGLIDLTSYINKLMIPDGSDLEAAVKPAEELAEKMTILFIQSESFWSVLLAFFSIVIVPAFSEEICFRGVLQPLLAKMTGNLHLAVWFSAFLFSMIHMQFMGFLPRLVLGALLGYLAAGSASLWSSILAHLLNNTLAFIMVRHYGSLESPEESMLTGMPFYIVSTALFLGMIYLFIRRCPWPWFSFEYLGIDVKMSQGHDAEQAERPEREDIG